MIAQSVQSYTKYHSHFFAGNFRHCRQVPCLVFTFDLKINVIHFVFQYCEYYPDYESCKRWLEGNMPDKFAQLSVSGEATSGVAETDEEAKKRQKRGGKGKYN